MNNRLFPSGLPELSWSEFDACGFDSKVSGVIYRTGKFPCCGVPVGGVGTGCIDIDPKGIYGFSTIFNPVGPRPGYPGQRIPRLLPQVEAMFGLSTGGKTWLLVDPEILERKELEWCTEPDNQLNKGKQIETHRLPIPAVENVQSAKEIHYWGHFPVADVEYETGAPISVGLRAWAPFIPGDAAASNIPGAVFEIRLRNETDRLHSGSIAFNFPGPQESEAPHHGVQRRELHEDFHGVMVGFVNGTNYVVGVLGDETCRFGSGLHGTPAAWSGIADGLPVPDFQESDGMRIYADASCSAAVDFELKPGKEKIVRFILTWYAPVREAVRRDWDGEDVLQNGHLWIRWIGSLWDSRSHYYTHMYAARYGGALDVARRIACEHEELLGRVLSWQEAVYSSEEVPVWLRDSLINNLYLIADTSYWDQAKPPLGDWAYPSGAFGMDESPRGCPHMCCIPCDWYGNLPIILFFPELARSTLRAFKHYQLETGEIAFALGKIDIPDFAVPEYYWQVSLNGFCYIDIIDRLWQTTGDDTVLDEFYESVKKCNDFTMALATGPAAPVTMPDAGGMEWFEFGEWVGIATHMGALRLSGLRMVERMALANGDEDYAEKCRLWFKDGSEALEGEMWTGDYYLNYYDKKSGRKSDAVMGFQLDGQCNALIHGLEGVLQGERVSKTLDTIRKCNIALAPNIGAANFTQPDGSPMPSDNPVAFYGTATMFCPEVLLLAMTYIQDGQQDFGLELAYKHWKNLFLDQRHTWDLPNMIDGKTGQRMFGTDYYQDMMLWFLPAALEEVDLKSFCKPGQLVRRILDAANKPG
jgi:uncharacterized protein (DUF608 family)